MDVYSKVAVVTRSYNKQGDNKIILSYGSFNDNIIFSHDVKCDEHLIGANNMTFAQLTMIPIIQEWNNILTEIQSNADVDYVFLQVLCNSVSYMHEIPKSYYNEESSIFGKVIAKMMGSASQLKKPTLEDDCLRELGLDRLGYFLFRISTNKGDRLEYAIAEDVEQNKLDYRFLSDSLKTFTITKSWFKCVSAIRQSGVDVSNITIYVPDALVDDCVLFCINTGYADFVYMFLQEHPLRFNERTLRIVTDWHNKRITGRT